MVIFLLCFSIKDRTLLLIYLFAPRACRLPRRRVAVGKPCGSSARAFWTGRLGAARCRCASLEVLCERCALHGAARSAAPEASTAARRRMRVRAIAGLEGERRRALATKRRRVAR